MHITLICMHLSAAHRLLMQSEVRCPWTRRQYALVVSRDQRLCRIVKTGFCLRTLTYIFMPVSDVYTSIVTLWICV